MGASIKPPDLDGLTLKGFNMEIYVDDIATHDAQTIKRLMSNGESLSGSAAGFGYTPNEAILLLSLMAKDGHVLVNWWENKGGSI
jgi:hypothetical protein